MEALMEAAAHRSVMGSSARRRRRRERLVRDQIGGAPLVKGDRRIIRCYHCGRGLRAGFPTWDVDRYPVPGSQGGTYRWGNVVISCRPCNRARPA